MRTRDESKEAAIRQKALEMIVDEGFDGLSMQKLAKAAGVSPATIYIYFKDRDDLIVQLWVAEMEKMASSTLKGFDPSMSFEEGLKIQWMNRARYSIENQMSAHFLEQIKYSPHHEICQKKMLNNPFQMVMREFVHNAIKRKELVKLPVEVYWSVAFAPLYQLLKYHMSGRGLRGVEKFELDEKTMSLTLKVVLKGLKP